MSELKTARKLSPKNSYNQSDINYKPV